MGGVPVTSGTDLTAQVRSHPANAEVELTYVRNGQAYEAKATLGQMATN
ncbi:S1C family serine protease [Rathayibacter iranicus]|nr:S1C family serine protease [Rathayibacter iranicus]